MLDHALNVLRAKGFFRFPPFREGHSADRGFLGGECAKVPELAQGNWFMFQVGFA